MRIGNSEMMSRSYAVRHFVGKNSEELQQICSIIYSSRINRLLILAFTNKENSAFVDSFCNK